jgi:hypothetical protein
MSIVTLKNKSYTLYGKSHVNKQGQFSVVGVQRQLPMSLGRSVTRTPFRGAYPMGHGEGSRCRLSGWRARKCGSSYPMVIHRSQDLTVQTLVKKSTMNMKGYMEMAYTGILHGANAHVSKSEKDSSEYTRLQKLKCPLVQDDSIHATGSCAPYHKNTNMDYSEYMVAHHAECLKIIQTKPNHSC